MKYLFSGSVLFLFVLFLASCSEISYKEPQPKGIKNLTQVPSKLHGRYLILDDGEQSDTLVVSATGYKLGKDDLATLSDSLVMKYYKGYYFINMRSDYSWYLRVVKPLPNGNLSYMAMPEISDEHQGKEFRDLLSKILLL